MELKITNNMKEKASKYLEAFVVYGGTPDTEAVISRADNHTALMRACMDDNGIIYCQSELADIKSAVSEVTDNLDKSVSIPADGDFDPDKFSGKLASVLTERIIQHNKEVWYPSYREPIATALHDLANLSFFDRGRHDAHKTWPQVYNRYASLCDRTHLNHNLIGDLVQKYLAYIAMRIASSEGSVQAYDRLAKHTGLMWQVYRSMYRGYITPEALQHAESLCGYGCYDVLVEYGGKLIHKSGREFYCPHNVVSALIAGAADVDQKDIPDIVKEIINKIKES